MTRIFAMLLPVLFILSCNTQTSNHKQTDLPIEGTWKLITGITIEKGDSTVTDYTKGKEFIKIINGTHFAFLQHDLQQGKDSATAAFSAGGGSYEMKDSLYTEHLNYCNAREWEGHSFPFTVTIVRDTLVQQGIEKVPEAGIERTNIEKYVRVLPSPASKDIH